MKTPAVCGSVMGRTVEEMEIMKSKALDSGADLIELRVDRLKSFRGWERLLEDDLPMILTNRSSREGGFFRGPDSERINVLIQGMEKGVPCVDIELSTPPGLCDKVLSQARWEGTTAIISFHDFSKTPPPKTLRKIARRIESKGDIAKIVTLARNLEDVIRLLDFVGGAKLSIPLISFAMGEVGSLTRIISPLLGSPIVYASVGKPTAPGQFDVGTAKRLLHLVGA